MKKVHLLMRRMNYLDEGTTKTRTAIYAAFSSEAKADAEIESLQENLSGEWKKILRVGQGAVYRHTPKSRPDYYDEFYIETHDVQ